MSAIAWRLLAASVTGSKEYRILVFDRFVVVGWGSTTGTMQYKVHTQLSAAAAQSFAVGLTEAKEAKGYAMVTFPLRSRESTGAWATNLSIFTSVRGSSPFFDASFSEIWLTGIPLD